MKPETKQAHTDPAVAAAACQLFRLPRKLLELVAAYFSRREAALVLSVNSTLHEIFAERVWRRLDSYLTNINVIPLDPLLRYGHLVRRIRVTGSIPESIDLAAALPNITHLWISFYQLAGIIKSSQGRCFERLCYLSTWAWDADYDEFETSDDIAPVLSWLDSRFEAESGLQKVEWEVYVGHDMQLPHQIADWLQSTGQFSRIHFKFDNEGLNFGDPQSVDFNKVIPHCLVDWKVEENDGVCAAYRFSGILNTIPRAERQHFQFPALKRLRIGTCCNAGDEVYSQFNFGKLFPSVWDLTLDTDMNDCQEHSEDTFGAILAHPWPSIRKLEIYGDSTFKNIMSHLAVVSNVEELTIDRESVGEYDDPDIGVINLCELDRALPKLVRLRIIGDGLISAPIKQQQQQQPLFRHLRYVSFKFLTMTSSAVGALVHAPVLADICLKCVNIVNDDDVDVSDDLDLEIYHEMSSALSHDFLVGVTNPSVQSVDIYINRSALPVNYEDIIRAMLKCFVRLKVCIIRSYDGKALPGFLSEFPKAKLKVID